MTRFPVSTPVMQFGHLFVTRKAAGRLDARDAMACLERHMIGDYGDVDDSDWKSNDMAWEHGFPVVSSYEDRRRRRFLIVTDSNRRATTILLPEEY